MRFLIPLALIFLGTTAMAQTPPPVPQQTLTLERLFASPSLSGPTPRLLRLSPDGRLVDVPWGAPGWESQDVSRTRESYGELKGRTINQARKRIVELRRPSGISRVERWLIEQAGKRVPFSFGTMSGPLKMS